MTGWQHEIINKIKHSKGNKTIMLKPNAHDDGICYALFSESKKKWLSKETSELTDNIREALLYMNTQWADFNKNKFNEKHNLDLVLYEVL